MYMRCFLILLLGIIFYIFITALLSMPDFLISVLPALRAIIEEFMLDIMYEIPKDDSIGQVTITQEYIENTGGPIITLRGQEVPRLESQA